MSSVTTPGSTGITARLARFLEGKLNRRNFLVRSALAGSAVSVGGLDFVLRPTDAYAMICGPGASCSSGWTGMCCSINDGVNQCPPGSFAGGWWKADGASLCGGKARYIVDCHPRCSCGCRGGSAYCDESCWGCKRGCADDKCDKRRVCTNEFRYGQCNRDIDCSGPVWCRAISCTPPWEWENCSRVSKTDNATRLHDATCLPRWSPIMRKYTKMGSQGSVLGDTIKATKKVEHGRMQRFTGGRMYTSEDTGPHYLTGVVLRKYRRLGQTGSVLRLPTTDVRPVTGGEGADFQRGAIYRAGDGAAHAIWGDIHGVWRDLDAWRGPLGLPVTDVVTVESPRPGSYARFTTGSIHQGRGLAARASHGRVGQKYGELNYQGGPLGYPTAAMRTLTDVDAVPATYQLFERGTIVQRTGAGVHALWGPINDAWVADGGVRGPLGVPISDVVPVAGGSRANCRHGYLQWDAASGKVSITLT